MTNTVFFLQKILKMDNFQQKLRHVQRNKQVWFKRKKKLTDTVSEDAQMLNTEISRQILYVNSLRKLKEIKM